MSTFFKQCLEPGGNHACIVEDDGRVAYAYLVRDRQIVGDLWLYNQAPTPTQTDWKDRSALPFLNPAAFVNEAEMAEPLTRDSELSVDWTHAPEARILIRGKLYGVLAPAFKPGWSVAARKDGPLAKCLDGHPARAPSPTD
ncbi:MAG: hypothetical protein KIS92_23730 [Planctomycetota bacterium]|nr:hypothetical protein [Planctomycetota bacterium]